MRDVLRKDEGVKVSSPIHSRLEVVSSSPSVVSAFPSTTRVVSPSTTRVVSPSTARVASPSTSRVSPSPSSSTAVSRRDELFSRFNSMPTSRLFDECRCRSLRCVGTKSELVDRLVKFELEKVCVLCCVES